MNNVLFVANGRFIHGDYKFDKQGEQQVIPDYVAKPLAEAGLGVIKAKPKMANKMLPDSLGNAGGPVASSQSSQAAQASTSTTSNQSGSGRLSLPKKGG